MPAFERSVFIPNSPAGDNFLSHLAAALRFRTDKSAIPVRFVITGTDDTGFYCEVGLVDSAAFRQSRVIPDSIFKFQRRSVEDQNSLNAVLLIPTGIGCTLGGHAGDATPVARLLAETCDKLLIHPNVVNASDLNEMPTNSLYCEGSVLTRLLMGTLGIRPVRNNRVLVVYDGDHDPIFKNATQNSINAARAVNGMSCAGIWEMESPVRLQAAVSDAGRAAGTIENLGPLLNRLKAERETYDTVAISSVIQVSSDVHQRYFTGDGEMINPWGGIEALLTHAITSALNVQAAHAPMMESEEIAAQDYGTTDPRIAAEAVSMTFFNCVLKGLQRAPQLVTDKSEWHHSSVMTASNISCLVIPDGCLGLPVLAALEQGIRVIAVRENENIMKNDLSLLPWKPGQLTTVENYWEAAGVMTALKAGIDPSSTRRPIQTFPVTTVPAKENPKVSSDDSATANNS